MDSGERLCKRELEEWILEKEFGEQESGICSKRRTVEGSCRVESDEWVLEKKSAEGRLKSGV